jgi:hypothetical protein
MDTRSAIENAEGDTMSEKSSQADWRGVGDSIKDLGKKLKEHADNAQDAIKSSSAPLSGVAEQVGAAFKTGIAKLDETVTDPAVGAAARGATGKFLDALKAQLGADQPAQSTGEAAASDPDETVSEQPADAEPDPKAPSGT